LPCRDRRHGSGSPKSLNSPVSETAYILPGIRTGYMAAHQDGFRKRCFT
jgi:hypothetical protein